METLIITCESFKKRMVDLCLRSGLTEFPTKRRERLILLKSIAIGFNKEKKYTEMEVNQIIKGWLEGMSNFFAWDHFLLRRELVDEEFLGRNPDGSCYWINPDGPAGVVFEPFIDQLDIFEVIYQAQVEIAQRKAAHLQKQANAV